MKNIKKIDKLKITQESKDGYKWLLLNFDAIQEVADKAKTVGDFRKGCLEEIGFAPALIFSFKSCYKSEEVFIKHLQKQLAN